MEPKLGTRPNQSNPTSYRPTLSLEFLPFPAFSTPDSHPPAPPKSRLQILPSLRSPFHPSSPPQHPLHRSRCPTLLPPLALGVVDVASCPPPCRWRASPPPPAPPRLESQSHDSFTATVRSPAEMGSTSSMLTQYDIEEVHDHCDHAFSQQEIVSLYHRFCQLDRNGGGFVSADEFMSVPEFAVNPLSQRLLRMLDGLNFKEFVAFLSAFSPRTSLQQKIEFIFRVYDTDCNGKVAFEDILSILRDLSGSFMTEQQRQKVLTHVLEEAGYTKDTHFTLPDFMKILGNSEVKMEVEVPID